MIPLYGIMTIALSLMTFIQYLMAENLAISYSCQLEYKMVVEFFRIIYNHGIECTEITARGKYPMNSTAVIGKADIESVKETTRESVMLLTKMCTATSCCIGAFLIGYSYGFHLSLVLLSFTPLMVRERS